MTKDWTVGPDGRSNTSPEFVKICGVIEGIIRNSAFDLMGGRAGTTAGVIAAQLAHVHGFAPRGKLPGTLVEALRFAKYEFEKAGDRQSASVMTLALAEYDEVGGTTERVHDAATALLESVHDLLRRLEPDDAESERAIAVVEHAAALKAALLGAPETMQRLHQRAEHEKDLRLQAEDRERTALNSARGVRVAALHEAANLLEAPGYDDRCAEMADRIRDLAAQAETQRVPKCKICHAEPNGAGRVEHGRGCRALRPGGGGVEYVDMPHRSFSSSVLSGTATKADLRPASIAMGMMHTHHALCEAWNSMEPSERTQTAREFAEILADKTPSIEQPSLRAWGERCARIGLSCGTSAAIAKSIDYERDLPSVMTAAGDLPSGDSDGKHIAALILRQVADEYNHTYVTGTADWLRLQAARLSERVDASEETRDYDKLNSEEWAALEDILRNPPVIPSWFRAAVRGRRGAQ